MAAGFVAAFALLSAVLRRGMPIGVAYGVWAALGVALTSVLSAVLYDEPFTGLMAAGIALIMGGVLLVELGSHSPTHQARSGLMAWLFLAIAIGLEVAGTLALRMATTGRRAWYAVVAVGYLRRLRGTDARPVGGTRARRRLRHLGGGRGRAHRRGVPPPLRRAAHPADGRRDRPHRGRRAARRARRRQRRVISAAA